MKFKVGDRVRVISLNNRRKWLKPLAGKEGIVKKAFKCANADIGCYDIGEEYVIPEDQLELVKPKFNINDYPGRHVMHVTTEEQANIFCEYLNSVDRKWRSGDSYVGRNSYKEYARNTCYSFNYGVFCCYDYFKNDGFTILEFEDFDWSDFTMKKEFTKADLKNGDVVKRRNGEIGIVCVETNGIVLKDGTISLSRISSDLRDSIGGEYDIVAVRRPVRSNDCSFYAFKYGYGELIYERKEVEEMTLEEVCKALGKEIKIVKEKRS